MPLDEHDHELSAFLRINVMSAPPLTKENKTFSGKTVTASNGKLLYPSIDAGLEAVDALVQLDPGDEVFSEAFYGGRGKFLTWKEPYVVALVATVTTTGALKVVEVHISSLKPFPG